MPWVLRICRLANATLVDLTNQTFLFMAVNQAWWTLAVSTSAHVACASFRSAARHGRIVSLLIVGQECAEKKDEPTGGHLVLRYDDRPCSDTNGVFSSFVLNRRAILLVVLPPVLSRADSLKPLGMHTEESCKQVVEKEPLFFPTSPLSDPSCLISPDAPSTLPRHDLEIRDAAKHSLPRAVNLLLHLLVVSQSIWHELHAFYIRPNRPEWFFGLFHPLPRDGDRGSALMRTSTPEG